MFDHQTLTALGRERQQRFTNAAAQRRAVRQRPRQPAIWLTMIELLLHSFSSPVR